MKDNMRYTRYKNRQIEELTDGTFCTDNREIWGTLKEAKEWIEISTPYKEIK